MPSAYVAVDWRRHQQVYPIQIQQQARIHQPHPNPHHRYHNILLYQVFFTKAAIHTMGGKKAPKQEELTLSK
jgi:hypothetical protein